MQVVSEFEDYFKDFKIAKTMEDAISLALFK